MNKNEFLKTLRNKLCALSKDEREERLNFYSEMIDDKIEDGVLEEDAIAQIGSVDSIASQIIAQNSQNEVEQTKKSKKRRLKGWEIALIALGTPIWLSLIITLVAVVFSLLVTFYAVVWLLVVCVWAVFGALIACAIAGLVSGIGSVCVGQTAPGMFMMFLAISCIGIAVFAYFASVYGSKLVAKTSRTAFCLVGKIFSKKVDE